MDDISKNYLVAADLIHPKRPRAPEWTAEQKELLRQKWDEGLTTREIGKLVGKTKNAVIGMSHRMDLPGRGHNPRHEKKEKSESATVRKYANPKARAPRKIVAAVPLRVDMEPVGIMALRANSCRAIVGIGADGLATYCGDDCFWDPELGRFKPFCEAHGAIYYNRDVKRRRR